MPLSAGSRLGSTYEILAPLGAGGMGEVYRARDLKLGRDVAVKVLPSALAQDADRMARFAREAQVLASLNHPNIASIYGLEEGASLWSWWKDPRWRSSSTSDHRGSCGLLPHAASIAGWKKDRCLARGTPIG